MSTRYVTLSWNDVKTICPNHADIAGPTHMLFNVNKSNTGVKITQNKSKELIKLKYVLDLLTVYLVNELNIGNK
mgnify:FL=1